MAGRKISRLVRLVLVAAVSLGIGHGIYAQGNSGDPPGQSKRRGTTRADREAARKRAAKQKKGVSKVFAGLDPANLEFSPLASGLPELAKMTSDKVHGNSTTPSPLAASAWIWPLAQPDYFGVGNYANSPLPAVSAGPIRGITVTNGGGGYQNPVVKITDTAPGTGSGAQATATVNAGVITGITVTSGGAGYSKPVVTITDANGIAAGATAFASAFGTATGGMRKFVDTLPGLTAGGANNLGKYIPLALADTTTFPGSDYYKIGLKEYSHQFHSDLPATNVRGYYDFGNSADSANHFLGPLILATRNRPVRVLFQNNIATDLNLPTDTTYMGAGMINDGTHSAMASLKRATLHLHGGASPWISDGTTMQWITPSGGDGQPSALGFAKGMSFQDVPDMVPPGCSGAQCVNPAPNFTDGKATFFWTNEQSGRLMFYHDHAYGITRLNVYDGEAAGYLLVDGAQEAALRAATVPGTILTMPDPAGTATDVPNLATADLAHVVPLVIQDKTFVPDSGVAGGQLAAQDPTWDTAKFGGFGNLWFPHTYMPNQNPADLSGSSAYGRWDYGLWFWPPQNPNTFVPEGMPYPCTSAATPSGGWPYPPLMCPGTPNPSGTPEGFMDTPVINGTAYPKLTVAPSAYRFQILSAGNDRAWNLQLYYAVDKNGVICKGGNTFDLASCTEVSMVPALPHDASTTPPLCTIATEFPPAGGLTAATLDAFGNPINGTGLQAGCWPTTWPTDGRDGGVPNPATAGPPIIQIGAEGGLLPSAAVIPSTPVGYEYNRRSITVLNIFTHGLLLGPAERADVVVDFSGVPAGSVFVLYNDAPAPVPAFDPRTDYYTGNLDQSMTGGAPSTQPGYGPNTRTIMQFQVAGSSPNAVPFSLQSLTTALPGIFATTQDQIIVPETGYPAANGGTTTPTYVRIFDTTTTYTDPGAASPTAHPLLPKTIQELFTLDYGRMNATLGIELPLTSFLTQTTIPYGYVDPPTEIFKDGETQLWKITHNGVDTHFIHFHLFTVQVVNRVGWDGAVKPPDLNELSFKDTVRMNPLEDIIVALKPIKQQNLPWPLPDSLRPLDVTMPVGSTAPNEFTNVDPNNNPINVVNAVQNFGHEYVWHCHILGHEENDMMRAMVFQVAPPTPSNLVAGPGVSPCTGVSLAWTDNSASESGFTLQRDTNPNFTAPVAVFTNLLPSSPNTVYGGTTTSCDTTAAAGTIYYYRVQAVDDNFKPPLTQTFNATAPLLSAWSNIAASGAVPFAVISPTALTFANQVLNTPSPAQTVTLSNTGAAPLSLTFNPLTGANPGDFAQTNTCLPPLAPSTSCTISVTFKPTGTVNPRTASLVIATNDPANPTLTVSLSGTAIPALISASAVVSPTPNLAGWNNTSPVTVTITAADNGGPAVKSITYSATGAQAIPSTTVTTNPVSIPISTQGVTTITFFATDSALNSTAPQTVTIRLDTTLPTATLTPAPNAAGWNCCSNLFTITGADNLSGVASITYFTSGANTIPATTVNASTASFALFNQGTTTVNFSVKDNAGNPSISYAKVVNLDTVAPTLTVSLNPPSTKVSTKTASVNVTGNVTDALSGVNRTSGSYSAVDGTGKTVATGTFSIASNGGYNFKVGLSASTALTYTITVKALDIAGNTGTVKTTFVVK